MEGEGRPYVENQRREKMPAQHIETGACTVHGAQCTVHGDGTCVAMVGATAARARVSMPSTRQRLSSEHLLMSVFLPKKAAY